MRCPHFCVRVSLGESASAWIARKLDLSRNTVAKYRHWARAEGLLAAPLAAQLQATAAPEAKLRAPIIARRGGRSRRRILAISAEPRCGSAVAARS